ncbi:MAG: DUF3179 domain-containing protein [Planctomycetota bacterium]
MIRALAALLLVSACSACGSEHGAGIRASGQDTATASAHADEVPDAFLDWLANASPESLEIIEATWSNASLPMALETLHLAGSRATDRRVPILDLLRREYPGVFGVDTDAWYRHLWSLRYTPHSRYARFKRDLYRVIDPAFARYFDPDRPTRIRLDEVRWGGVRQDGIPPLRNPVMIEANDADYLDDSDTVFAIEVNGDARAYPKRILAWHEMFTDTVGGVPVAGVYCTLCGTVILYESAVRGVAHELGTSGFLYRSNKLMYDRATHSLWNTLTGEPVVGQLVDAHPPIALPRRAVVTTTWGAWKRRHPGTTVLSIDTGHRRDYREGAAYRDYFATDALMFTVPKRDDRLRNKDEVLGITLDHTQDTLAIHEAFLRAHPVHHDELAGLRFVVLTDPSGANRVYASPGVTFVGYDGRATATDADGTRWTLTESLLTNESTGATLERLPAQRAFWFGWRSAFERTRLVK